MPSGEIRYRFGPLEKRGLIMGLRLPQIGVLVVAGIIALASLHAAVTVVTFFIACLAIVGALFACFWPLSDSRTLEQVVPVAASWMIRKFRKQTTWATVAPLLGHTRIADTQPDMPPTLKGISIIAAPVTGGDLGVIRDVSDGSYAAVIVVRGRSFALLDHDAKARLLGQWADVLSGAGREGSPIKRLQWLERTVPDPGDAIGQYLRDAIALPHTSAAVRSYLQLVGDAGPTTQNHETFVVIQIDKVKAARAIKLAGTGDDAACAVLVREAYTLASRLQGADLDVVGLLTPRLLAQSIRISFDPASRTTISMNNVNAPSDAGVNPAQAWPTATDAHWAHYRTDSAFHVTYWIAEWPRSDTGPDFLAPLLLQTWVQRTVSVTLEPVSPFRAQRDVEAARTVDVADTELRQRHGFLMTMRRQREQESVLRREQELADGHADIRFSGYVTVSAADPDALEVACGEIEQQANQARLLLRRLGGLQDVAFSYTLPLARGLR